MAYKVFLVDDDRYVRKGLINLIDWEGCGFEVCAEADNGEDAFEHIERHNPDLVITDIKMPVLDGLELIKQTVESKKSAPNFIIITGYSDFTYAQRAVKYNVQDFLLKPVNKQELETTLKTIARKQAKKLQFDQNRESILATTVLNDLISGQLENDDERIDTNVLMNIHNSIGMSYIIIEINNICININKTRNMISSIIHGKQQCPTLFREHDNQKIGVLIRSEDIEHTYQDIYHFSEELKEQLTIQLRTNVMIYVGKIVKKPIDIKESYDTAIKSLQFKYLESIEKPIVYGRTKNPFVNYIELEQTLYQSLMEQIEENQIDKIKYTTDSMFKQFQEKAFAKDAVRTSINRVVHEVIKILQSMDGDEEKCRSLHKMLNFDNQPHTLDAIKEIFLEFILEAAAQINQLNLHCVTVNIRRIKKYIDTHYNEELTLKNLANRFFINPAYMGQLFRKTYGVYLKDYLLQVRINEAKKKLRQTDLRIYEIAEDVGFTNSNYFITQFEKITGYTPTQYRKSVIGKKLEMETK
ncbi:response regulator transcription factor [Metabacillus malikii]|uniref:Two-component system response regulator YesN n=1 Tax=Metabacillus malikii TaxID=1504265 RepID=A0ABT9ZG02_9BACI|nr:response regulator [Metabacillus malikii]MDQ0231179.1 two-component system response regulator YesN [Metabacillus malikii]